MQNIKEKVWGMFKKIGPSLKWVIILIIGIGVGNYISSLIVDNVEDSNYDDASYSDVSYEGCNVSGINLHGSLMTYIPEFAEGDINSDSDSVSSEYILYFIKQANTNEDIKAIVIEVDSGGGSPVAGAEIDDAIKKSDKPVFAFIRDVGASASYLAISSADRIWASKHSDVGGIGVTMSYLSNVKNNENEGYSYEQLSAGKFKDAGSVDKPLTDEEKKLFMRDVNIIYENFMKAISENRKIPIEKVREISDGSTVLGEKAKELNLIDEIGLISDVENYLEQQLGQKPEICW